MVKSVRSTGSARRCRHPSHVARDCHHAWGGPALRPASKKAPAPAAQASGQPVAPATAAGNEGANSSPPGDAPAEEAANGVELVSESSDLAASDGELLSGDEEVLAKASAFVLGSPSSPRSTKGWRTKEAQKDPSGFRRARQSTIFPPCLYFGPLRCPGGHR